MKKFPIGFNTSVGTVTENEATVSTDVVLVHPKKSVVQVYFPHKDMAFAYYNDRFDLKVGDLVYVEGHFEGCRGRVTEVSYSFKIKLSEYKRVVGVVDTHVAGDFYFVQSHLVTFDRNVIPFFKVLNWFKPPESEEEYATGNDDATAFPLNDLSKMNVSQLVAERGHTYYQENKVCYIELDDTHGRAIVEGGDPYEIEFDFSAGEISNLTCSCFCGGSCKHQFATMLQLKETLSFIRDQYEKEYNGYFAAISKKVFVGTVVSHKTSGKISL